MRYDEIFINKISHLPKKKGRKKCIFPVKKERRKKRIDR